MIINRNNLYQQVAATIGHKIIRRDIKPGEVLPTISELCSEYQVSQTVLREALKLLTAKGLVSSKQRVGVMVRPRSDWSLFDTELLAWRIEYALNREFLDDLIGFRQTIEPGAASLAAAHATEKEIEELWDCYTSLAGAITQAKAYMEADVNFHTKILAMTHNELLQSLNKVLSISILAIIRCTENVPGGLEASLPGHKEIVTHIEARDSSKANDTMLHLVGQAAIQVNEFLSQQQKQYTLAEVAEEMTQFMATL